MQPTDFVSKILIVATMRSTIVCVIALLSVTFLSFAAGAPEMKRPLIIAHRGASHDAPENTLSSYRLAFEQNADGIEGDFYLTKDGVIIDSHDPTLKRCGNVDRKVVDMTLAEIKQVDVGSWKDPKFKGERVPTLTEVLAILPAGKLFLIEVKCGPEIVPELLKTIDASKASNDQLRVIAFDAEVVAAVKKARPELKTYWLTSFKAKDGETTKHPTLDETLATLKRVHADGLDANAALDVVDGALVKAIRDAGFEWHAWTVDKPEVAKALVDLGVDSLTTNRPAFLREALAK